MSEMTQPADAPKRIWLQWDTDGDELPLSFEGAVSTGEVCWCSAQQYATDIEYVLASDAKDAHAQGYAAGRASLVPLLEQAFDALQWSLPSSRIDLRYCAMKALEAALKEIKAP